jgi:hypothetical protein
MNTVDEANMATNGISKFFLGVRSLSYGGPTHDFGYVNGIPQKG